MSPAMLKVGKKAPPKVIPYMSQGYGITRPVPKPVAPKPKAESATMQGFTNILNRGMTNADAGFGGNTAPPQMAAYFKPGSIGVARKARPEFDSTVAGMIPGDYEVQDAEAAMGSRMAQIRGAFGQNIRQAMIDLGTTDAGKLGKFGSYIDTDTIQKAAANKYSTTAQIQQQETKARDKAESALAARGILHSGQTTKTTGDITAEAEKGRYSALQDFLSGGEQGLGQIAESEYELSQQVARARANAAQRAAERYWWEWGGEEGEEAAGEWEFGPGATDLAGGGYSPGAAPPRLTVAQAYKKLPAAVKKPTKPTGIAAGGPSIKQQQTAYQRAAVPVPKAPAKKKK